jgi:hypothetical protein
VRTTVTLDPDVDAIIRSAMRERGVSFKEALNDAVRRSVARTGGGFRTPTFAMGTPAVPLTKALSLAAELEDEEIVKKLAMRK